MRFARIGRDLTAFSWLDRYPENSSQVGKINGENHAVFDVAFAPGVAASPAFIRAALWQ